MDSETSRETFPIQEHLNSNSVSSTLTLLHPVKVNSSQLGDGRLEVHIPSTKASDTRYTSQPDVDPLPYSNVQGYENVPSHDQNITDYISTGRENNCVTPEPCTITKINSDQSKADDAVMKIDTLQLQSNPSLYSGKSDIHTYISNGSVISVLDKKPSTHIQTNYGIHPCVEMNRDSDRDLYTCGSCEMKFDMVCKLHHHLQNHLTTGSYIYNINTKTAYPKYDSICKAVQTFDDEEINCEIRNTDLAEQLEQVNHITEAEEQPKDSCDDFKQAENSFDVGLRKSRRLENKYKRKHVGTVCKTMYKVKRKKIQRNIVCKNDCIDEAQETDISAMTFGSEQNSAEKVDTSYTEKVSEDKSETAVADDEVSSDTGTDSSYNECDSDQSTKILPSKSTSKEVSEHRCDQCGKRFKFASGLKVHRDKKHSIYSEENSKIQFKCKWCHETFSLKTKLAKHARNCSKNDGLKCIICEAKFTSKSERLKHLESHENHPDLTCKLCGKRINNPSLMQIHMKRHHKPKTIQCDQCGRSFHFQHLLKKHMVYCNNERPVSCPKCGMTFKTKEAFKSHSIIHSEDKPYVCHYCGYTGKKMEYLKRHIRSHTGERPYSCKTCGMTFVGMNGLNRHNKTHTNTKSCVCQYCGKSFTTNWNLKTHIRQHTGDTPYKCNECGMGFKQNVLVKLHMKSHHPFV